jgi:hypothetical protein
MPVAAACTWGDTFAQQELQACSKATAKYQPQPVRLNWAQLQIPKDTATKTHQAGSL